MINLKLGLTLSKAKFVEGTLKREHLFWPFRVFMSGPIRWILVKERKYDHTVRLPFVFLTNIVADIWKISINTRYIHIYREGERARDGEKEERRLAGGGITCPHPLSLPPSFLSFSPMHLSLSLSFIWKKNRRNGPKFGLVQKSAVELWSMTKPNHFFFYW